jgi:hypothetical protein
VDADDDPLEQLLIGRPRGGQQLAAVLRDAAHQAVRGDNGTERPGVHVLPVDPFRRVDLASLVESLLESLLTPLPWFYMLNVDMSSASLLFV